jgi:DNA polymerase III subunit alpha
VTAPAIQAVSLHHHTTYSFGDGFGTPEQHAGRAAHLGYPAIAFTEHGNVSSHFRAEKACNKIGIKPIFGIEAYTGAVDLENRRQMKWHLGILAMNREGYANLNGLVTQSYRDLYYDPTVSGETLAKFNRGLIVLSGCTGSKLATDLVGGKGIPDHIDSPDMDRATETASRFQALLGDRYYLEVQAFPELEKTCAINPCYEKISKELCIPLVATLDVHYPRPEDNEMQVILHAAHRGKNDFEAQARSWNYDVLLTLPESYETFYDKLRGTGLSHKGASESLASTVEIADRCNVTLPKAERLRYPVQESDWSPWT